MPTANAKERKLNEYVGTQIRYARLYLNMIQDHFAEWCGLDRTFIARMETGVTGCSLSTLAKIADGLKVNIADLLPPYDPTLKKPHLFIMPKGKRAKSPRRSESDKQPDRKRLLGLNQA